MLLQLGIALTCSVASFSFSPTKINPNESIIECEEEVADENRRGRSHHEAKTRLCLEPETKQTDEKVDGMSPASAITSLGDSDLNALLLPELEDLFPAENGMSFISPPRRDSKSLPKHEKTLGARKNLSIWLDNEEIENHEPTPGTPHGERDRSQDGFRSKPQKKGKSFTKSVLRNRLGGGKHGSTELEDLERKRNCLDERDQNMLECCPFTDQHSAPGVNFANKKVDVTPDVAAELNNLRIAVAELREREGIIQGELLEYYGLEEQHSYVIELEKDLRKKVAEIEDLKIQVFTLERQKKEISEEATIIEVIKDELIIEAEEELRMKQAEIGDLNSRLYFLEWEMREKDATSDLQKELAEAKHKINELQRQIHTEMGRTQMQRLKQKVKALHGKDENRCDQDIDIEKKLEAAKILEVEVVELRRRNKDLEHQKRELKMKLAAADAQINVLSSKTESDIIAKVEAEAASLKRANEDLCKHVETLQSNRFSEVEEIVYLRWINACLRYELRSLQSLVEAKAPSLELNKSASPRSQEKAKQLILEYGRPREEQEDSAYDSTSSQPCVSSSCISSDGLRQEEHSQESCSKTSRIIKRLKSWGRSKDDAHIFLDAPSVEIKQEMAGLSGESSPLSSTENGLSPLEALILRNSSNATEVTAYGAKTSRKSNASAASCNISQFSNTLTPTPSKSVGPCGSRSIFGRSKSSNVAASFELMSLAVASTELTERYPPFKDRHKLALEWEQSIKEKAEKVAASKRSEAISSLTATEVKKRSPRKAKPPPEPSPCLITPCKPIEKPAMAVPLPPPQNGATPTPPPPPPPPPLPGLKKAQPQNCSSIQRAPEVVQFYQSLMKRDLKKDSAVLPAANPDSNLTEVRNDMIGEIQNRSSHLLAIKADVETQGEFIQSLAKQVLAASYSNIDDVVAFVSWLDEELSFLVDERAVLKHFDWPEGKADAFREAAFEYQDLKKLEHEISSYKDDHHLQRDAALKKMLALLEKVERSVYALLRTREKAIARYKEHSIPVYWILDSGIVGKIKQSSVKLAQKYMRRIIKELDRIGTASQKPTREFLLLQGVRFAFRVHQFAGGFDHDSMRTFEELRSSACKC